MINGIIPVARPIQTILIQYFPIPFSMTSGLSRKKEEENSSTPSFNILLALYSISVSLITRVITYAPNAIANIMKKIDNAGEINNKIYSLENTPADNNALEAKIEITIHTIANTSNSLISARWLLYSLSRAVILYSS